MRTSKSKSTVAWKSTSYGRDGMWLDMTVLDKDKKVGEGEGLEGLNATRIWLVECPSKGFRICAAGTGKPFNSMELGSDMLFRQITLLAGLLDSKASPTLLQRGTLPSAVT